MFRLPLGSAVSTQKKEEDVSVNHRETGEGRGGKKGDKPQGKKAMQTEGVTFFAPESRTVGKGPSKKGNPAPKV